MKYSFIFCFILVMASSLLNAQNQSELLSLPTDLNEVSIAGSIFIGTDTLGRHGLIGQNGNWLNKKRFEYFLGPVSGVYFGVSDRSTITKKKSELNYFRSSILYALGNDHTEPKEFIYRLNSLGEVLDSFRLSKFDDLKTVQAGVLCWLGFPKESLWLLPASGNPVPIGNEWIESFNSPKGLKDKVSIGWKLCTARDSALSVGFPDSKARLEKEYEFAQGLNDREPISKKLSGFTYTMFPDESIIVVEKKENARFWTGKLIGILPSEDNQKVSLWLQSKEGVLRFQGNEVSPPFSEVFLTRLTSNSGDNIPVLYSGTNGDFRLISDSSLMPLKLPQKTRFLFSYLNSYFDSEMESPESENLQKKNKAAYSLYSNAGKLYLKSFKGPGRFIGDFNFSTEVVRPSLVFEKNSQLFAVDPNHREVMLPPIKDTAEFLSCLRFLKLDGEKGFHYELVWNDIFESRRGLLPIMDSSLKEYKQKEALNNLSYSSDNSAADKLPEILKVPSKTLPIEFKSGKAFTFLFLYYGSLFTEKGKRLPISGTIRSVAGTLGNDLLIITNEEKKMCIRDAKNQICFSFRLNRLVRNSYGFLEGGTMDGKQILLNPKKRPFKASEASRNFYPITQYLSEGQSETENFKGSSARVIQPLYTCNPEQTFFLTDETENEAGQDFYRKLLDGYGNTVAKGLFSRPDEDDFASLKNNKSGFHLKLPFYSPMDSCIEEGKKTAWIFQDMNGIYYKANGIKNRLNKYRIFVPPGSKMFFYEKDSKCFKVSSNGKIEKSDFYFVDFSFTEPGIYRLKSNIIFVYQNGDELPNPYILNLNSGQKTFLKSHQTIKSAYRIPDWVPIIEGRKWLVCPDYPFNEIETLFTNNRVVGNSILALSNEALAVYADTFPLQKNDFNQLMNGVSWLDNYLKPVGDSILPLMGIMQSSYGTIKMMLGNSKSGLNLYHQKPQGTKSSLIGSVNQILVDQRTSSYCVKKENGLLELFDYFGSLGLFRKVAASIYTDRINKVILAEKPDGELVGFILENQRLIMYRPETHLKRVFIFLPPFKSIGFPDMVKDSVLTVLPDASDPGLAIGFYNYSSEEGREINNLLYTWEINKGIFNPYGLSLERIKKSALKNFFYSGIKIFEIQSDGKQSIKFFPLPPGYSLLTPDLQVHESENGSVQYFLHLDSVYNERQTKDMWVYSLQSGKLFPLESTDKDFLLISNGNFRFNQININSIYHENYFISEGKPVRLSSVSDEILSIDKENDKLIVSLLPWSGFIDKTGKQRFSLTCEGGACTNGNVEFRSGMAVLKKTERVEFCDLSGKNPFDSSYACASDFIGNYSMVTDPQPKSKKSFYESEFVENADSVLEYQNSVFWLHKNGNLLKLEIKDRAKGAYPFDFNSFFHNGIYTFACSRDEILLVDTNGKVKSKATGYSLFNSENDGNPGNPLISEGLFRVEKKQTEGIGFLNTEAQLTIPCRFRFASNFSNGLAAVTLDDNESEYGQRVFYIDRKGNERFPNLKFSQVNPFSEGLGIANRYKVGLIILDTSGKILAEYPETGAAGYKDGMALFSTKTNGHFGYFNREGKIALPPQFTKASDFSEGIAMVTDTLNQSYFIDKLGKRLPDFPEVSSAGRFSNGLCYVVSKERKMEFDPYSGKLIPIKAENEPPGFNRLKWNKYSLRSKSEKYSIWSKSLPNFKNDFRILKH